MSGEYQQGESCHISFESTRPDASSTNSLELAYIPCAASEKMLQLVRLLRHESVNPGGESARFIVYFATCAAVDYFCRVSRDVKYSKILLPNSEASTAIRYSPNSHH